VPAAQHVDADLPDRSAWIGGQGTDPYEQNTQQSPGFGFNRLPQLLHW
jgi:hypothetical protein